MNVKTTKITEINKEQKELFFNLYNLYLYELSEYTNEDPMEDGKFDPTNTYLYLEREELHPFFIYYYEQLAGFILVCSPPFVDDKVDYTVQELFLLKKFKGKNVACDAVSKVFSLFSGNYKVTQLEKNVAAVRFWKKFYDVKNIHYLEGKESVELDGLLGYHDILSQTFCVKGESHETNHSKL